MESFFQRSFTCSGHRTPGGMALIGSANRFAQAQSHGISDFRSVAYGGVISSAR
jgi:hypothetical protein